MTVLGCLESETINPRQIDPHRIRAACPRAFATLNCIVQQLSIYSIVPLFSPSVWVYAKRAKAAGRLHASFSSDPVFVSGSGNRGIGILWWWKQSDDESQHSDDGHRESEQCVCHPWGRISTDRPR